jgi:hypothetical protein
MNEKMTRVLIVPTINHPPKQGTQSSLRDKQNDDGSQHPAFLAGLSQHVLAM